jgi:hypothetical protein
MKKQNSETGKKLVYGQPSWRMATSQVEAFVTELGGHLGPVNFRLSGRTIQPFSIAPWALEKTDPKLPAILKVLRGDFFCMPFGGNSQSYRGEQHPTHGETANAHWKLAAREQRQDRCSLHLKLATKIRRGQVDKRLTLVRGHHALYCEHILSGMRGPMNLGHHAMLKFPDEPGSGLVSTSRFVAGQVFPGAFEQPSQRGYSFLKPGANFDSLQHVPTITGEMADLSRYPARAGFEDLVLLVNDVNVPFAWTAVTFPKQRYVWFALKDPRILRETLFWISNGGRHYPPWNGRHTAVMGMEEITSYFALGLNESARSNPLSEQGHPTCLQLNARQPLRVAYIMAVASIPPGFDHVTAVESDPSHECVVLKSKSGRKISVPLNVEFLERADSW